MRVFKVTAVFSLFLFILISGNPELRAEVPDPGPGRCVANCGDGGGGGGRTLYRPAPSGPSYEERERAKELQDLREAALDANDTGIDYFEKGDWRNAIKSFKEALEYTPDDEGIVGNLRHAQRQLEQEALRRKQAEEDRRRREKTRRALEESRKRAMQEAAAAKAHGEKAAAGSSGTYSKTEGQKVFDTGGDKTKLPKYTSSATVDATGYKESFGRKVNIPESLKENPQILKMQQERKELEGQFKELEKQLSLIRQNKQDQKSDRGKLDVQEVKTKEKMDLVKQKAQAIDVNMEIFVIELTREKNPSKTSEQQK